MRHVYALSLLCGIAFASGWVLAQTNPSAKPDAAPEPLAMDVSGPAWEAGELRTCSTYSNHPKFLLCDDDLRTSIVVGYLDNKPIDREQLIASTEAEHTKRFLVQFSKIPWKVPDSVSVKPSENPDDPPKVTIAPNLPFSKPDTPDQESRWDCSKEKAITCTFVRTFKY